MNKKIVIVFGPQAVGKMTVGEELAKETKLKLFHNHMTIDLVSNFFSYGSKEGKYLVHLFRKEIFETVAKSDLEGIIFTYVWAFDMKADWEYIENIKNLFESNNADVYYVELCTSLEERLKRNITENRLAKKPTKRDTTWTEEELLSTNKTHRLNSNNKELKFKNYIKINNTNLTAKEVANKIRKEFNL